MLHIITPRYRPPLSSKLDWFCLQTNMVIPWEFTPLIFLVVINTMYYVTHAIVEDLFVSLTHMSMNIMFLENVVGNLVNIITIDWPIQVGVFFCSTIQWNNSVECSQKKSAKLSKLKFIMWILLCQWFIDLWAYVQ